MTDTKDYARDWSWTIAGAIVFAVAVLWVMPSMIARSGDDFAYYQSVAESVRAGYWVQSQWLEPYNLTLTALGAGAFHLTGQFPGNTLLAWKLFPALLIDPRRDRLSGFLRYVEGGRVLFTGDDFIVNREGARMSVHPMREYWTVPAGYEPPVFPMNNDEWCRFAGMTEK